MSCPSINCVMEKIAWVMSDGRKLLIRDSTAFCSFAEFELVTLSSPFGMDNCRLVKATPSLFPEEDALYLKTNFIHTQDNLIIGRMVIRSAWDSSLYFRSSCSTLVIESCSTHSRMSSIQFKTRPGCTSLRMDSFQRFYTHIFEPCETHML
jgi:hypothetical protein